VGPDSESGESGHPVGEEPADGGRAEQSRADGRENELVALRLCPDGDLDSLRDRGFGVRPGQLALYLARDRLRERSLRVARLHARKMP
jgi:hypothetical protein